MKKGSKTSSFGTIARINHDSSKFYNSKLYRELSVKGVNIETSRENTIPEEYINTIILGSSEKMDVIPNDSLHLMITSPPYNASKDYDDDLSLKEYLELLENVFKETYRVLVNGGRACVNAANLGRKPYMPLSDYISQMMIKIGFNMRGEIIWNKGSGAGVSMAWGSWMSASNPVLRDVHEYILIFSKGNYKRIRNGKANTIRKKDFMEWTKSVWSMNPESARRVKHPAPFPEELPYRLIQLYSYETDIVLDPFMGSGTTAVAALKSSRKYIGYEVNANYIKTAEKRLKSLKDQKIFKF